MRNLIKQCYFHTQKIWRSRTHDAISHFVNYHVIHDIFLSILNITKLLHFSEVK